MNKEDAIKYLQQIYPSGGHCWLDEQRIEAIRMAIKALQEEPISDIDFEQELYKAFGQVKDFTLGMRIAKWFYNMSKKNQEPVSEELEEAALRANMIKKDIPKEFLSEYPYDEYGRRKFIEGAQWQKEQFEKNRLAHCDALTEEQAQIESNFVVNHLKKHSRTPTFIDAIEYGMRLQKEQMMANAIDVEMKVDAGGYPYIPQMELYDYDKDEPLAKEGDKYKVVLIKEE